MSPRTLSRVAAAIAAATLVVAVPAANADFTLISQNLTINRNDHVADFSLTFNQAPNFSKLDSDGLPVNSFQYNFDGAYAPDVVQRFPHDLTAVVRGDEIHLGDGLRIRLPDGDGGADSGGWGPIIGSVPLHLIGNKVTFTVPTSDLGYTGGYYRYDVFSLQRGAVTAEENVTVIPLPSAFYSGLLGLSVAALAGAWLRRRHRIRPGIPRPTQPIF